MPNIVRLKARTVLERVISMLQGGSNMTGTDLRVNKPNQSRSYLNYLVYLV